MERGATPVIFQSFGLTTQPDGELIAAYELIGRHCDGFIGFELGTMFAPTKDRLAPGEGFTHIVGDIVTVTTPLLGALVNRVDHADKVAPWTFGTAALMRNLAKRGLL